MSESDVTFHNQAAIRVQAQIFSGRTLVSSCLAAPGEVHVLPSTLARYDIYLKNSITGWELAHKLNSDAKTITLTQANGRYIII